MIIKILCSEKLFPQKVVFTPFFSRTIQLTTIYGETLSKFIRIHLYYLNSFYRFLEKLSFVKHLRKQKHCSSLEK